MNVNKHLMNAGGTFKKISTNSVSAVYSWINEALRSAHKIYTMNPSVNPSCRIYVDMGRVIGTKD